MLSDFQAMKSSGHGALCPQETLLTLEKGLLPQPSVERFARSLIKCSGERTHALRVCAYVYKCGLEAYTSLANCLVSLLAEVVSIHDAQQVFDKLPHRNEESCGSLITGYIKCGKLQRALEFYQKIEKNDVALLLSKHTFVALLKACKKLKDLKRGSAIHAKIACARVFERDVCVGSTLIDMYAGCGVLARAHQVLEELPNRNVVAWTALISGYAEHGHSVKALELFEQMQSEGISPNAITFVCTLKACVNMRDITKGQGIHAEIERRGLLESNLFVGSALVDIYYKCGLPAKAQQVFDKLSIQDVVLWTALIAGYAEYGDGEKALNSFKQMQLKGFAPEAHTFAGFLKACGSIGAIDKAAEVHAVVEQQGLLKQDVLLGGILVDTYAKNGFLQKAKQVFDKLSTRDVISWTSLIEGYTESGLGSEALQCFDQMQREGVVPDAYTLVWSLKACSLTQAKEKVRKIHDEIKRQGLLEGDMVVGNTLLSTYAKCGALAMAQQVFEELPSRNIVAWNTLIAEYAKQELFDEALRCYELMKLTDVEPDMSTIVWALKACSSMGEFDIGEKIIAEAEGRGLLRGDHFVSNTFLVDLHTKSGSLAKAQRVFDKAPVRDVEMWNTLATGYVNQGQVEQALSCFYQMKLEGVSPNAPTFINLLKACGGMGAASKGQELHMELDRCGLLQSGHVGIALMDMYVECGLLDKVQQVFSKLRCKDDVSWTTLMIAYTHVGDDNSAFHAFDMMLGEGVQPNMATLVVILKACSHKGMYHESNTYFEAMTKDYGIYPAADLYSYMINFFNHSSQIDKAVDLTKRSQISPDLVVHKLEFSTSRSLDLGKQVSEEAVHGEEKGEAAYA